MQDTSKCNNLSVYAAPLPFSNKRVQILAPHGSSIQDIIDLTCPPHLWRGGIGARVQINGQPIPRQHWNRKPRLGTNIVVNIVPAKGGGKSPLASLLSIAVMIAAPYMSAAILGPTLAATQIGIGTLTYGGLLSGAIGIVGRMLVSALAPPPKPSNTGTITNPTESPTQFIEGARNALLPFGVIPVCLGTNRMVPPQAARPYTETRNNDQYVRQLFTYGYGEELSVTDFRIGETSIDEFKDFQMEHRLKGDLNNPTNLFPNDPFQDEYSILLQQVDGYTLRQTRADIDEAIVDFTFTQGLCSFDPKTGKRKGFSVQLEIQYSPAGLNQWSAGAASYKAYSGQNFTVEDVPTSRPSGGGLTRYGYRRDIAVIDEVTGAISVVKGTAFGSAETAATAPPVPVGKIRLGTYLVRTTLTLSGMDTPPATIILSRTDDRQPSLYGFAFENSGSFAPTFSGTTIQIAAGGLKVNILDIRGSQTEALRRSVRIPFPARGTYDIRFRRLTGDTASDQIFDKVSVTAIKNIIYQSPVTLDKQNGTAVMIKATDQLNGALDNFNALVSLVLPDYNHETGEWRMGISSNPASLYRFLYQGPCNARPLADNKLSLEEIEAWHVKCEAEGYTYNRVIDYETSIDDVARDICAAGAASPAIVDGKRTIVIDCIKPDIIQIVTPRNSWGYSGEMIYTRIPHAFRVQFRNAEKGYQQDEIIVYDDGYDESNATEFEGLELQSCTNAALAFKTARRHIAAARLRPETHSWMMALENLTALRGDRITLEHDAPIIGIGDGRIKTVITDMVPEDLDNDGDIEVSEEREAIVGFTIDDTVTVPTTSDYYTRIRLADGTQIYREVITTIGDMSTFYFAQPLAEDEVIEVGDLCYFVEAGGELDLIITRIEPQADFNARITGIAYNEAIFEAENSPIPPFDSKITTPLEFVRPIAPVLVKEQSDESVMILNSDGSFTPRAIFTLENKNEGEIYTEVKVRVTDTVAFGAANTLELNPERVALTGLDDNVKYDIHIRYGRNGGSQMSPALELNGYRFIGASGVPTDPTGFKLSVADNTAIFEWDQSTDIDRLGWRMRFSGLFSGATKETAQLLKDEIYENRFVTPFQPGTYFLIALDQSRNESANAAVIITYDPGMVSNAIEVIDEAPDFGGVKDNVAYYDVNESIQLADIAIPLGYYYFEDRITLDGIYTSFVSASIAANGTFINNFFDFDDVFAEDDVFGGGDNDIFAEDDVFGMADIYGIEIGSWEVTLEFRVTMEDPIADNWTDWAEFIAGNIEFYAIEFRLRMESFAVAQGISPEVTGLKVTVDMPDRIERGEDLEVPDTGTTIVFSPAFRRSPAIAITIQDGDAADEIQYMPDGLGGILKDASGFSFRVYNRVTMTYVTRSFDFIASGYGRENT